MLTDFFEDVRNEKSQLGCNVCSPAHTNKHVIRIRELLV